MECYNSLSYKFLDTMATPPAPVCTGRTASGELTVATLESELGPAAVKWETLGRKLGLQDWRLEVIAADLPAGDGASMKRLSAVLREWRKNVTDGSWSNIICALREMEENVLARDIEEKYCNTAQGLSQVVPCEAQQERSKEAVAIVRENERTLNDHFAQLQTIVYERIQKKLGTKKKRIKKFLVYMTNLFPPGECIPETMDVSKIFRAITRHRLWDYLNYQPLEKVAKMYESKDQYLMTKLEAYIEEVNGFKLMTKMADYLSTVTDIDDMSSSSLARKDENFRKKLIMKIRMPITEHSLSYVDEVWNSIAKQFLLPPSSAILDKIMEGSLYVTWLIPAFFVPQMIEMAEQPEAIEFFREMKTDTVTVDGACIYGEQEEEGDSCDGSSDEDQEPPRKRCRLATAADTFQEESVELVADQHRDTQAQSSSVCGLEEKENQLFDETKFSSEQVTLPTAADSFQEMGGDTAADKDLEETIPEESSLGLAEAAAVKSVDDKSSPHIQSPPEPHPHPHSPLPQVTGYDVELVKESHDLRCPICLLVLRDPMQVNCCGKRFCRACIEIIIKGAKPCPACKCKAGDFDCFEDKGQKQAIMEVKVHCSNRKVGCGWTGEICQLDNHLNHDPEKDAGCQYAELKCIHCSKDCQRYHMRICPQQPYICPYCNHYTSTYEDVSSHHLSTCEEFPVQCEMCLMKIQRKSLQHHHLECDGTKDQSIVTMETLSPLFVSPPNFIMTDFTSHKESDMSWHSPPFYSHIGGCKMCLEVRANGYGSRAGTHVTVFVCLMCGEYDDNLTWPFRGHITLQLVNQRRDEGHVEYTAPFDDSTPDAYAGRVTEGERALGLGFSDFIPHSALHYDESWSTEYLKNDCLEFRITQVKLTKTAEVLPAKARDQQSRDTARTEQPEVPSIPPVNIIMSNFISYKNTAITWHSPPFYSHTGGYKMCLAIDANGTGSGAGTHVTLRVRLMCGEYDDNLTWPFRGNITIQLINQKRNEGHLKKTVYFDDSTPDTCAGRVTEGEHAPENWGVQNSIPHSALQSQNTRYLKNNCLEFRVTQVKLTTTITEIVHST